MDHIPRKGQFAILTGAVSFFLLIRLLIIGLFCLSSCDIFHILYMARNRYVLTYAAKVAMDETVSFK